MKLVKKLSIFALSALLTFGSACTPNEKPTVGDKEGLYYGTPNQDFTVYDNKNYNEYLMGEKVTIANQWEGYGIGDPFVMRWNGAYYLYCSTLNDTVGVRAYKSVDLINWAPLTVNFMFSGMLSFLTPVPQFTI